MVEFQKDKLYIQLEFNDAFKVGYKQEPEMLKVFFINSLPFLSSESYQFIPLGTLIEAELPPQLPSSLQRRASIP